MLIFYLVFRSLLMQTILRRMSQGVLPGGTIPSTSYILPTNVSAYTTLIETLKTAFSKGSIDLKTVHKFEHLITVGGTKWFCEHVVRVGNHFSCLHSLIYHPDYCPLLLQYRQVLQWLLMVCCQCSSTNIRCQIQVQKSDQCYHSGRKNFLSSVNIEDFVTKVVPLCSDSTWSAYT